MATSTSSAPTTATGTFTLLLFASASTFAGNLETLILPAPTSLRKLFAHLKAQFPGMIAKVLQSSAITVNLEYVDFDPDDLDKKGKGDGEEGRKDSVGEGDGLDLVIQPGDEVGIIPPVSSG